MLFVCGAQEGLARQARVSFRAGQNTSRQERAAALVAEGTAALERGDASAAQNFFEQALAADAANVAAHTYLGVLADRAGNLAAAERHFAAAAINDPLSPSARNNHGAILFRLGRLQQAAAQFETSLRLNPQQPSALVNLAQIKFAGGTPADLRAARDLFERARALAPDEEIARALVIIALRLKDRVAAIAAYQDYAGHLSEAGENVRLPAARAELGAALLEAGLTDEAAQELGAAAGADPANTQTIVLLARANLARKDIPAAGRTLEGAVARGLETGPIYETLAEVYQASGHIENAIPAMRLAIARDPGNESYRFRYGMLLTETKAPAAAIIRLQEALKEFPGSARLWFALGAAQFAAGQTQEASGSFKRVLELDSRSVPALAYLGMMEAEQGRSAEAVALYERALAIDEANPAAHYLAADAMLKQAAPDLQRAEAHLSRAVALDESFAPARLALGKLYLRLNRPEEAAAQLERVVALDPNMAEAHYQLGRVYTRLKRATEAQTALAKFKRLSDEQKEQSQNERREIVRRLANVLF